MNIPFLHLLKEFSDYTKKEHARVLTRKCKRVVKYELAEKIIDKYNIQDNDDFTTAFAYSLIAANKNQTTK